MRKTEFRFDPRMDKNYPHGCDNCVFRHDKSFGDQSCWFKNIGCNLGEAAHSDAMIDYSPQGSILKPDSCPWIEGKEKKHG